MAVMRSLFYTPGNNAEFLAKAMNYGADNVTIDIEDAVPPAEKVGARKMAADALKAIHESGADAYVRVNAYDTEWTEGDVDAIVNEYLDGICLPKTSGAADVKRLDEHVTRLEKERGIPEGKIKFHCLIETAIGVVHAYEAAVASPRVVGMIFGAVDYTRDMKVTITKTAEEQFFARSYVAIAARAAGVAALDAPFKAYKDTPAFEANLKDGVQMGYEGRMIIHPSQIEPANRLYAPSDEKIAWAEKIVPTFEQEGIAKGSASISVDGEMVDTPVYITAKDLLARRDEIKAYEAKKNA